VSSNIPRSCLGDVGVLSSNGCGKLCSCVGATVVVVSMGIGDTLLFPFSLCSRQAYQPAPQVPPQRPGDNSFGMPPQGHIPVSQPYPHVNNNIRPVHAQANPVPQQENRTHLFEKVTKALSGPINKATEMVDNFVQKFEGDPYIYCPEGKYNKS